MLRNATVFALVLPLATFLALADQPRQTPPSTLTYFAVDFEVFLTEKHPLYDFAPDHPCGRVLTLRSNRLPLGDSTLEFDNAYELSPSGEILTYWWLPTDAQPLAIEGDRLVVDLGAPTGAAYLTPSGYIGITENGPNQDLVKTYNSHRLSCPAGGKWVEYLCSQFIDGVSKRPRLIAYEPVCT
jgi:hypothetical protein